MATEAQNIMQAFRAADEAERVKEEGRVLYGPITAVQDATAGVLGAQTAMNVGETFSNILDPRSFNEMLGDERKKIESNFDMDAYQQRFEQDLEKIYGATVKLFTDQLRARFGDNLDIAVNVVDPLGNR
tara:strand:+ start:2326 stop:2712 length:387 start_codon:yes stop_codon:yes gene_type:complete